MYSIGVYVHTQQIGFRDLRGLVHFDSCVPCLQRHFDRMAEVRIIVGDIMECVHISSVKIVWTIVLNGFSVAFVESFVN